MRVFIIGGTGFIGPHVVRMLHAEGHCVTVFHRGRSTTSLPEGVEELRGERDRLAGFRPVLQRMLPDVVIDMIPLTEADARLVVNVMSGIAGRLVAVSSQDVYRAYNVVRGVDQGPLEPVPLTEGSALRPRLFPYRGAQPRSPDDPRRKMDDYDKILVERVVMNAPGLPGTVVRLPMVYGPGDRQHRMWEYLKPMVDRRPALLLEEGMARWQWTRGYVENVAWAIVRVAVDARARTRIYNAGEADALSEAQWAEAIARAYGWKGRIVTAPLELLPEESRHGNRPEQHLVSDTSRIRMELGYEEQVPRSDAMRRTVEWEAASPPEGAGDRDYAAEDQVLDALGVG